MKENNKKLCLNCENYYITWDKNFPKGCKGFGFKGMKMPCDVVVESSGQECRMYIPKNKTH